MDLWGQNNGGSSNSNIIKLAPFEHSLCAVALAEPGYPGKTIHKTMEAENLGYYIEKQGKESRGGGGLRRGEQGCKELQEGRVL